MISLLHGGALRDDIKSGCIAADSRLGNDSIRLPRYELSVLQLILCIKISPGTEGFTVVAVAGKHDGVDKATNQNENDII